jgi:hypothetical protein
MDEPAEPVERGAESPAARAGAPKPCSISRSSVVLMHEAAESIPSLDYPTTGQKC